MAFTICLKAFSVSVYVCTACFLISYLFWLLEMYLLKGAKSSEETGIFTALIVLWRDEMSDEKHEEIRRLGSALPD